METNKLFVWNLDWNLDWKDLKEIFWEYGEVVFVRVVTDRETWKSRWFAFVEFADALEAKKAMEELNWKELNWRELKIDFAKEREQ